MFPRFKCPKCLLTLTLRYVVVVFGLVALFQGVLNATLIEVRILSRSADLHLPFHDVGLHLTRMYRYDSSRPVPLEAFGYGWVHVFGAKLVRPESSLLVFTDSDGTHHAFAQNLNGQYRPLTGGFRGTLTRNDNGTFQVRTFSGDTWHFNSDLTPSHFETSSGNLITFRFSGGKLLELQDSADQYLKFVYDTSGRINEVADSTGFSVRYDYDQTSNLVAVRKSGGGVTRYEYDDKHRLIAIEFGDGRKKRFTYEGSGRLEQIVSGNASRMQLTYDEATSIQTATDLDGTVLTQKNSVVGLPLWVKRGDAGIVNMNYDDQQNLSSIRDENENLWQFAFQPSQIRITDPEGAITMAHFSQNVRRLTKLTDENGNSITYSLDQAGRTLSVVYADGRNEENEITKELDGSTLVKHRVRSGGLILYRYDRRGLLVSKQLPDGSAASYKYDAGGNLLLATNNHGNIAFEYDSRRRLSRTTFPGERSFFYSYDEADRLVEVSDPDRRVVRRHYDADGRLILLEESNKAVIARYQFEASGRLGARTLGNGLSTNFTFDAAGSLQRIVHRSEGNLNSEWLYDRDDAGNTIRRPTLEGIEHYTYDKTNQLTNVVYVGGLAEVFRYDPAGNRLGVTIGGVAEEYTVDSLHQYVSVTGKRVTYDTNRNLRSFRDFTFDYDAENRLVLASSPSTGAVRYEYDALGRLASRTAGGVTSRFLWDGDQMAIEETADHVSTGKFTWGMGIDEILMVSRPTATFFVAQDGNSNVTELTDEHGRIVQQFRYRAFGQLLAGNLTDELRRLLAARRFGRPNGGDAIGNPFRFAGAFFDSAVGIYYMRARWYSPELGRFLQADPSGISGGGESLYICGKQSHRLYRSFRTWVLQEHLQLNQAVLRKLSGKESTQGGCSSRHWAGSVLQLDSDCGPRRSDSDHGQPSLCGSNSRFCLR